MTMMTKLFLVAMVILMFIIQYILWDVYVCGVPFPVVRKLLDTSAKNLRMELESY